MWTTLGREQKAAFGLLIVLGISGLILGSVYFKNRVHLSLAVIKNVNRFALSEDGSAMSLQAKDTDQDGLSDYDELYFYNTSPYIEDTDSDGELDKEEIDKGEDPNCPKGEICGGALRQEIKTSFGSIKPPDELEIENPLDAIRDLDASQLRSLLRESGMTPDMLDQISDQELESMYKKTLIEIEDVGTANALQ